MGVLYNARFHVTGLFWLADCSISMRQILVTQIRITHNDKDQDS